MTRNLYIVPQDVSRPNSRLVLRKWIYRPYLQTLRTIDREFAHLMPKTAKPLRENSPGVAEAIGAQLKRPLQIARAGARGTLFRVKN
jgi:hypothetical protein